MDVCLILPHFAAGSLLHRSEKRLGSYARLLT